MSAAACCSYIIKPHLLLEVHIQMQATLDTLRHPLECCNVIHTSILQECPRWYPQPLPAQLVPVAFLVSSMLGLGIQPCLQTRLKVTCMLVPVARAPPPPVTMFFTITGYVGVSCRPVTGGQLDGPRMASGGTLCVCVCVCVRERERERMLAKEGCESKVKEQHTNTPARVHGHPAVPAPSARLYACICTLCKCRPQSAGDDSCCSS